MAHDSSIHNNRSKPVPRGQRNLNRARQYKRDTDNVPDVAISLMDLDSAIMYYFTEVIKPTVVDNGETVKVPIMYSSPERWSAIQKTGFMRDKKRQVILPVIAFRRTGMTKDTTIPLDTMDPEEPKLHWQFEKKYTDANRYDAFSVQQGLIPQREFYNVAVPDFMVLNYDFIVWASYIEQMNKLVERINWSEGAYWGEPGKMKFRTSIDSYTDSTDVSGKERIVKTEFSVTLKGYLIPEAFNELAGPHTMQKHLTPKTLVIKSETDVTVPPLQEVLDGTQPFPDAVSGITQDRVQPITLGHAFTLSAGNGITLTNEGDSFDGATAVSHTISIPQAVGTTANVQFNSVTGSLLVGTTNPLTFNNDGITGDISITGSLTATSDLSVSGNASISGTLTAQEFHTEYVSASIMLTSGSTRFGDTIDDTHYFTGSMYLSGSLELNKYSVDEISNDTSLTDNSSTALVTEYAAKQYISNLGSAAEQTYLRKQYVKLSTSLVNSSTASFSAVTASAPDGMTSTSEHDFLFFINGQYMEHDALTIQQASSTFYLQVDTDGIGYDLESDDEILAWGKFNS
tara:strand:+ start:251 stop:1963 length:1713 start_codon:yes stop_codon:yes gene_type:complete